MKQFYCKQMQVSPALMLWEAEKEKLIFFNITFIAILYLPTDKLYIFI